MLEYLKNESNLTYTENGAVTYRSSLSDCLDFFARIGGMRGSEDREIIDLFTRAFSESPDMAMKLLFYTRDIRGGIGERKAFRLILRVLAFSYPESVKKNIGIIPEYGRYDDLLVLLGTPCEDDAIALISETLKSDRDAMKRGEQISLLAKWLPSLNASNKDAVISAKRIAKRLSMSDKNYRKMLSSMRAYLKIVENNLRERDYTFDYEKQPSQAMLKYRNAFIRNDNDRYFQYLDDVKSGKAKMQAKTLAPYQIIAPIVDHPYFKSFSESEILSLDTTWNALEDFTNGENALVVVDGSGSMYCNYGYLSATPASVALSLGIYFAERNVGEFSNHFITFSETPRLVEIKGDNIVEKTKYCMSYNEVANTNIEAVFKLILNTAIKNKLPQEEMPSTIYIISDMEFDGCAENSDITNFENAKKIFANHGYKLPQVVFWNVNSRTNSVPVKKNDQGALLVSGFSVKIFSMIKSHNYDPITFMLEVLESERYSSISA